MPGGVGLDASTQQFDDPGGGSLKVRRGTQLVGLREDGEFGFVAELGARVEFDDEGLLLASEGAQPLEQPGEETVGIGGRPVPDRAVRDVRDLATEPGGAHQCLGHATDLAVVVEQQAGRWLARERGALTPGPGLQEISFRTGGDEGVPSWAVGVVGATEDGRHRAKRSGLGSLT